MKKLIAALLCVFLFTSCVPSYTPPDKPSLSQNINYTPPFDGLELHFIDVSQGDAALIRKDDTTLLIDAGTSESSDALINYIKAIGVKDIDIFISTHPHEDHMGGSVGIIENFHPKEVYMSPELSGAYFFEKYLDALDKSAISPRLAKTDCVYKTDDFEFKFLTNGTQFNNSNDNSLVVKVTYKNQSFLFMGDGEKAVERFLMESGTDISADVLKVGHHGSKYASESKFIENVMPTAAIISSGEGNSYGHPHEEAIKRLSDFGTKIFRTDKLGDIRIYCDGENIYDESGNIIEKTAAKEILYFGNKKSKKLHREDCGTRPAEKNSVIFKDKEDAFKKGYSPCKSCNP